MRSFQSLAVLALATTLSPSTTLHPTLAPRVVVPVATSTSTAADTPLLQLTPALLRRMSMFMAQVQNDPAHLRTLAVDSANYAHVPRQIGPLRGVQKLPEDVKAVPGTVDALLDFGAIAAKDPVVAAAFKRAHLAPAQYLPFATALQAAEATEAMERFLIDEERDTLAHAADSATNVVWRNVAFLRAHWPALDALNLPLPSVVQFYRAGDSPRDFLFLDTTQHPHILNTGLDWPHGLLDSTEAPGGPAARATARPWRVLFIGNSLTYHHTMPLPFSVLAAQGLHRRVVVGLVSVSGAYPFCLWFKTDARRVLAALPWDVVVVQLQSNVEVDRQTFSYYVRRFTQAIAAHHARAVFWTGPRFEELAQQARRDSILAAVARAAGVTFVPVGQAWAAVRQRDDSTGKAVSEDGGYSGHPSALGAYLNALVMYRTLTGRSPVGLPYTTGPIESGGGLSTVPARTAELLQHVAAATRP